MAGKKEGLFALHALALPVIIEYFLQTLTGTVDIYFAGSLGDEAIAAVSLTNLIVNIFISFFTAISVGVTAIVSRNIGRNDFTKASNAAKQSTLLGVLVGLGTGVLSLVLKEPLLRMSGAQDDILKFAVPYFLIVAVPSLFLCMLTIFSACLRATADSVTPMLASSGANLLNVVLNWLFIKLGLGIAGLALATTISRAAAALLLLGKLTLGRGKLRLGRGGWKPDREVLRSIAGIGLPAGAEKLIMRFGQLVYNGIIISLGTAAYVAHNVAGNIEGYCCLPAIGFGIATATQVGISLGEGSPERARDCTYRSIKTAGVYTVILAVCFYIFAPGIAVHFTKSPESQTYIVQILHFIAFFEIFSVFAQVLTNALQGAGDTKFPMFATMVGIWGLRVGLGYLLAIRGGLGLLGIWLAYASDIVLRSAALFVRFRQGKWQKITV